MIAIRARMLTPSRIALGSILSLVACSDDTGAGGGTTASNATVTSGAQPSASTGTSGNAATNSTSTNGASATSTSSSSGATGACANPWFADDLEWSDVDEAIDAGPWQAREGDVSISTHYAHSGTRSLRVAYAADESAAHLELRIPGGADHLFCRWWELRERAGDFPGAQDYDWGGEKLNRFRSNEIGVEPDGGLDYPLGWVADGGFGLPGTQGGGDIQLFGNSEASNGAIHFSHPYAMARGEWHSIELELDLGTRGEADGAGRLFIDGALAAEAVDVMLRPETDATIDQIWIGGWYSNSGVDPDPSPAVRYVDDVVVCPERIGP